MTREFWAYFSQRMEAWGRRANLPPSHLFWSRLAGLNGYCRKEFIPDRQASASKRTASQTRARYTQLNYCFAVHKTIECRLFPVFKQPRIAVSAIQELCSIYEDFIRERECREIVETIDDLA